MSDGSPEHTITNETEYNQRADVLLARAYPLYSRAALVKLFDMQKIYSKNTPAKPGDKIKPGASIQADISEIEKPAESIVLPVIYEDDNIIVVDKPSGVISHARGKYWDEPSVASFIREKVVDAQGERSGIVHRLDRATSGVMVCAKNQETLSLLQKQFSDRKVHKTYLAVIEGKIDPQEGIIDVPVGRNPNNPKTFMATEDGKHAITEYHTVESNDGYSLIKLHPLTGRTHQLRVHLAYMRHPIVGDTLYNGKEHSRLLLHAHTIEITIPGGERKLFIADPPSDVTIQL